MAKDRLREGFTTGSAAAAAAKAALLRLAGLGSPTAVEIPLPTGRRMTIPIADIEPLEGGVRATVIKDGGDDPDATHGARIGSTVQWVPSAAGDRVVIQGGPGVGRVTRPGLPVAVGEAAINPAPRAQIAAAVQEALEAAGIQRAVCVTVDVVNGAEIAKKTLNPRLGIMGGISILGTRGTVKPFSNRSYRDTITLSMDVARAGGMTTIALTTGGRSEGFLKALNPELAAFACIQVADFFAFSLREAVRRGFSTVLYACFFGKMVKMAQGVPNTHARKSAIDFRRLSRWCEERGMEPARVRDLKGANTARQALSMIMEDAARDAVLADIVKRATASARRFAGPAPNLRYHLFDFQGTLLKSHADQGIQA